MLNVFISLRCNGSSYKEMLYKQKMIFEDFKNQNTKYKDDIRLIDSLSTDYVPGESNRIYYLGKSIQALSEADIILMPMDYIWSKGCRCEKEIASIYGVPMKSYIHTNNTTYFIDGFIDTLMYGGN